MTRHVLLLNSDKPEVTRLLAARRDVEVHVLTRDLYRSLYEGLDVELVSSFSDWTSVAQAAQRVASRAPISHVVAPTEKSVPAAGLVRSLLGLPGAGFEASLATSHKRAMKDRLRSAGVPVTDFAQASDLDGVEEAAARTGWPVVVKPVFGSGAARTHRLESVVDLHHRRSHAQLDDVAASEVPLLVERAVDVQSEYHCDSVVRDGEVLAASVCRYFVPPLHCPPERNGSVALEPGSGAADDVLDLNRRVLAAIGLDDAVTHLEVFGTPSGPVVGEVAIRVGGLGISRSWQIAHGVDLWDELVKAALDEPTQASLRPQDRSLSRSHVPFREGLDKELLDLDDVVEVHRSDQTDGRSIELFYTTADAEAAATVYRGVQAMSDRR